VQSNNWDQGTGTFSQKIRFDVESDQNPDKTLALSVYKISFSGNKTSAFYVDVQNAENYADRYFRFDFANDLIYKRDDNGVYNRIYPDDLTYIYTNQQTSLLQNFWDNCIYSIIEPGYPLKVHWGRHPSFSNPNKYKVYRAKGDPALQQLTYTWVGETSNSEFIYTDNAIISDELYTNLFSYYVTAVGSYSESSPSNVRIIYGRENWSTGLSMTTQGSNPRLVWVPYDGFTPAGYKIYRSINTSGGGPGTFGLVATTTGQGTVWVDQDLAVGSPWKVYYKVKAYKSNPSQESDFTNVVETGGSAWMKQNLQKEVFSYTLSQNYPNPFNPMTNLTYSVADAGLTQIKVYDLLGREISALVNEYREKGTYSVNFNAGNLPSGVYIYTIRVNDFQQSKKMTLLK
jgi:hypothetical protein